jgi:hypothetical protein
VQGHDAGGVYHSRRATGRRAPFRAIVRAMLGVEAPDARGTLAPREGQAWLSGT